MLYKPIVGYRLNINRRILHFYRWKMLEIISYLPATRRHERTGSRGTLAHTRAPARGNERKAERCFCGLCRRRASLTDCASDPVDGALPALASSWASGRRLVGGRVPVQLQLCPFALARCNLFKRALARASACASLHIEVLPAAGAAARVTGPTLFSLQVPKRELVPQSQTSRRLHALARSSRQVPRSVGKQEGLCSFRTNNSHPQYLEESLGSGGQEKPPPRVLPITYHRTTKGS